MRWRNHPTHKLVALGDLKRLTGLAPEELMARSDTQQLVRIDEAGKRIVYFRIPLDLMTLPEESTDGG